MTDSNSTRPEVDLRAYACEGIVHAVNNLMAHLETFHDSEEESREAGNIRRIMGHLQGVLVGMEESTALQQVREAARVDGWNGGIEAAAVKLDEMAEAIRQISTHPDADAEKSQSLITILEDRASEIRALALPAPTADGET